MHNVPLSEWMGLKSGQGHTYFHLLVFPVALWEFFLVPICRTALKVHQNSAISLAAVCSWQLLLQKTEQRWKWKWNRFLMVTRAPSISCLFVCLFLADGLVLTHPTQHTRTGLGWIQLLTTVPIRTAVCNEPRRVWPIWNLLQEFQRAATAERTVGTAVLKRTWFRRRALTTQRTHEIWFVSVKNPVIHNHSGPLSV